MVPCAVSGRSDLGTCLHLAPVAEVRADHQQGGVLAVGPGGGLQRDLREPGDLREAAVRGATSARATPGRSPRAGTGGGRPHPAGGRGPRRPSDCTSSCTSRGGRRRYRSRSSSGRAGCNAARPRARESSGHSERLLRGGAVREPPGSPAPGPGALVVRAEVPDVRLVPAGLPERHARAPGRRQRSGGAWRTSGSLARRSSLVGGDEEPRPVGRRAPGGGSASECPPRTSSGRSRSRNPAAVPWPSSIVNSPRKGPSNRGRLHSVDRGRGRVASGVGPSRRASSAGVGEPRGPTVLA